MYPPVRSMLFSALLVTGCMNLTPGRRSPTTLPTDEIRLSDAQVMDDLQADDLQVNLTDKLDEPQTARKVYFGEADQFSDDDPDNPTVSIPLIAVHVGEIWKYVPLAGAGLENAGWKYVGAGPGRHEVWGVLDTSAGESRSQFVLAHSTDGALTFKLSVFNKPCKLATISDFAMSHEGHGRVTVSLDSDCENHKAGLYHYETTDDGKTWSSPRFEPDAMIRADTVPDDEQPDQAAPPVRTLFHFRPAAASSR